MDGICIHLCHHTDYKLFPKEWIGLACPIPHYAIFQPNLKNFSDFVQMPILTS